jgi:hypothetical protein
MRILVLAERDSISSITSFIDLFVQLPQFGLSKHTFFSLKDTADHWKHKYGLFTIYLYPYDHRDIERMCGMVFDEVVLINRKLDDLSKEVKLNLLVSLQDPKDGVEAHIHEL